MDVVKAKMSHYKFLDYEQYLDLIENFYQTEPYCKRNKVVVPEHIARCLFALLDADNSGELEPNELEIFDRRMMGQSREAQAKKDAQDQIAKLMQGVKLWISETTGLI